MAVRAASAAAAIAQAVPAATQVWVPNDNSGAGLVLTPLSCRYLTLGGMTFITGCFQFPATASGLAASIGGLPLPVFNQAGAAGMFTLYYGGPSLVLGIPTIGTNAFAINTIAGAAVSNATLASSSIRFQFFYPTA